MTLTYELGLDILKMYLHMKNVYVYVFLTHSKVGVQIGQTDRRDRRYYQVFVKNQTEKAKIGQINPLFPLI